MPLQGTSTTDVLSSAQYYRLSLQPLKRRKDLADAVALVERVRSGDLRAREELILLLLNSIEIHARRYSQTYQWAFHCMDSLELVQVGNLAIVACLDRALAIAQPPDHDATYVYPYLLTRAYHAMHRHAWKFHSPITTPPGERAYEVRSLDAPAYRDDEETLLCEVLAIPEPSPSPACTVQSTHISQALNRLTDQQRAALASYSLFEEETPSCPGKDLSGSKSQAIARLYRALAPYYPHYQEREQEAKPPKEPSRMLTPSQKERLDQACATLQASENLLTGESLQKEAGVRNSVITLYMQQAGLSYHATPPTQRMAEALAALQGEGEKVTATRLARRAHVSDCKAATYLLQQGIAIRPRQTEHPFERLDAAFEMLQSRGQKISARRLSAESGVTRDIASRYVREKQENTPHD